MKPTARDAGGSSRAAWLWLDHREPSDPLELARFAVDGGVAEVFVGVPWGGPDRRGRETVSALRQVGIAVSALGGSAEWARRPELAGEWAARAVADGIFDGIHLDIEPWMLPDWPTSAPLLLAGLAEAVHLVRELTGQVVEVDLAPHVAVTHPTQFSAVSAAADAITLMSYRDTAPGILDVSARARRLLASPGRAHRLAVDTLPSGDPGSSFAGRPRRVLEAVLAEVVQAVGDEPGFAGVAVHDLVGWWSLPR